jgi:hypothetical protein
LKLSTSWCNENIIKIGHFLFTQKRSRRGKCKGMSNSLSATYFFNVFLSLACLSTYLLVHTPPYLSEWTFFGVSNTFDEEKQNNEKKRFGHFKLDTRMTKC